MGSTFTWLDYSEDDRRRVLDTVDLFRERDTRDALGLGPIRDGFADLLSPGTSTIQTRARYFLLIPWLYREVEGSSSRQAAATRARLAELELIESLIAGGDLEGLIGRQARRDLKRLASDVYWQGLHRWGIRPVPVAREAYHRWIDAGAATPADVSEEGEPAQGIWHAGLPAAPSGFPDEVALTLQAGEAEYLAERLIARSPGALLTWLVRDGTPVGEVEFPWRHPGLERMPAHIREQLRHARCFSEAMHGAQLLYNLMLARQRAELGWPIAPAEGWEVEIAAWREAIARRADAIEAWDLERCWEIVDGSGARVTPPTRNFVRAWLDRACAATGGLDVTRDATCQALIHEQECRVKRSQARLENRSMLLSWGGASGAQQLNYRWDVTREYADEIAGGRGA